MLAWMGSFLGAIHAARCPEWFRSHIIARDSQHEVLAHQHEKAFQKQETVFVGAKRQLKKGKGGRFYKNVGLGFKTPKEAIEVRLASTHTAPKYPC